MQLCHYFFNPHINKHLSHLVVANLFAVMHSAAMNTYICSLLYLFKCFYSTVSLGRIPKSVTARSKGIEVFNALNNV